MQYQVLTDNGLTQQQEVAIRRSLLHAREPAGHPVRSSPRVAQGYNPQASFLFLPSLPLKLGSSLYTFRNDHVFRLEMIQKYGRLSGSDNLGFRGNLLD